MNVPRLVLIVALLFAPAAVFAAPQKLPSRSASPRQVQLLPEITGEKPQPLNVPTPRPTVKATPRVLATPVSRAATPRPTPVPLTMFPFALPPLALPAPLPNAPQTSAIDVSFLNDAPAGRAGFVSTRGEHFIDGTGKPLRLWGVNFNFSGAFPSKEETPLIAARLARFGFNAVRLHHYEGYAAPSGIWKTAAIGSSRVKLPREFDPVQLDRFDFFISELIKRGIYIDLNLHVGRKTLEGEGVLGAANLPEKDKGVSYFDPKLIGLQKDFSRAILTHVNPYLKHGLSAEPGVCAVEMNNEDSLLGLWLDSSLQMPLEYSRVLADRWNAWLKIRYDEKTLRAAWTEVSDPIGGENLLAQPLPPQIVNADSVDAQVPVAMNALPHYNLTTVTGAQGKVAVDTISGPTVDGFVRPGITVSLDRPGTVSWAFQLNRDGLDVQENQPYTLSFWARADTPRRISVNLWQDRAPTRFGGFTGYANLTVNWEKYTFVFRPSNPDPGHSRLSWNLGNQTGQVQFGQFDLRTGGSIAAPPEWTLANGVPLIDPKTTQVLAARRDYAQFLGEIESDYVKNMRAFLRDDLKVRVPIWDTQAQFGGWGGIARETQSDAIDVHAYWKHPDFGAGSWNSVAWKVGNVSMTTAAPTDPLSAFALFRLRGKPFVMSEWNSGQPNDFGAETLPMIAAYAAWQDWAGVFLFDYHSGGDFGRNRFENFFSIDTQPVKMATAPLSALLFRRPNPDASTREADPLGDLDVACESVTLTMPLDLLWREVGGFATGPTATPLVRTWNDAGVSRALGWQKRVYINFGGGGFPTASRVSADSPAQLVSDTGQVLWDTRSNIFRVNAPRSKVAVGSLGGSKTFLDELSIAMPPSQSNWAMFGLSSLDGAEVSRSRRLLLTACGKAENLNMGWNKDRSSVGTKWGDGPTQVEGISADIALSTDMANATVWALDENGNRNLSIASTRGADGLLRFSVGAQNRTLWYEIAAP